MANWKNPHVFFFQIYIKKQEPVNTKLNDKWFLLKSEKQAEQLDWFLDFDDWNPTEKKQESISTSIHFIDS